MTADATGSPAPRQRERAHADGRGIAPLLAVRGVEFSYGSVQILFGIDLEVAAGESLAILGTNGAGKSTLLRLIAGLARPDAGQIVFDGADVTGSKVTDMVSRGLVMIPGGKAIFSDMTVAENLEMAGYSLRSQPAVLAHRRQRVLDAFPRLGERLGQVAGTMSGGEQQQLALAKGFLLEPKLLCVDELSLGLAPATVAALSGAIASLRDAGTTIVLVEQSLNTAAALCSRAVFLEKGEVRFEGRTADLLERSDIARAVFLGGDRQAAGR